MITSLIQQLKARTTETTQTIKQIQKDFRMTRTKAKQLEKYGFGEAVQEALADDPDLFPKLDALLKGKLSNSDGKEVDNG